MAKLPDYHAVAVVVPVAQVDAAVAAMRGVPNVAYTQSETIDAGTARVRAIPKINAPILSDVASAMRNAGINVAEIFQDRGDLDDVFRLITTGAVKSAA